MTYSVAALLARGKPTRRAVERRQVIEQAIARWDKLGRDDRIIVAKAYLIDAVLRQGTESPAFVSARVSWGNHFLKEALATPALPAQGAAR